ncbi:MAG: hypothetical protein GY861_12830 [bacterium]|nr:hypothetical protein [bacterium]
MALRNQPYIPLYVQDFLTDEKLNECSAMATGVYIKIMCVMHKSKEYGVILLKQKDKQNSKQIKNFALKLDSHMSFHSDIIEQAIDELIDEDVLYIVEDKLCQKRMINDNELSIKRAKAGKKGGEKTQFALANNQAKTQANSENENESENDIVYKKSFNIFREKYPGTKRGNETEFKNFKKKTPDWKDIIILLESNIDNMIIHRAKMEELKMFVPEWKNLATWINNRCWEDVLPQLKKSPHELEEQRIKDFINDNK